MHSPAGLKRRVLSLCVLATCLSAALATALRADPDPIIWRLSIFELDGGTGGLSTILVGPSFTWADSTFLPYPIERKLLTTGTCSNGRLEGQVTGRLSFIGFCDPGHTCPGQFKLNQEIDAFVPQASALPSYPGLYTATGSLRACGAHGYNFVRWRDKTVTNGGCTPLSFNESESFGTTEPIYTITYNGTSYVRIGHFEMPAEMSYIDSYSLNSSFIQFDIPVHFVLTVDTPTGVATKGTWGRLKAIYR